MSSIFEYKQGAFWFASCYHIVYHSCQWTNSIVCPTQIYCYPLPKQVCLWSLYIHSYVCVGGLAISTDITHWQVYTWIGSMLARATTQKSEKTHGCHSPKHGRISVWLLHTPEVMHLSQQLQGNWVSTTGRPVCSLFYSANHILQLTYLLDMGIT